MTKDEKQQFIGDLIATIRASIIARVDDMPEEWDSIELRRYIADRFEEHTADDWRSDSVRGYNRNKRLAAYRTKCIDRNL
jgi:hypothetical protein